MDVDLLLKIPLFTRGRWGSPSTPFRESIAIRLKMFIFSLSDREENVFVSSFITMIAPFKSTPWQLGGHVFNSSSWHDRNTTIFPKKFEFPTWDRDVIKFYSSLGSNSLDGCWPFTEYSACSPGEGGEVPQLLFVKVLRYVWKCSFFRFQTERKMCSSALLLQWLPPSKASLANGRSCVQFFLMT